MTRARNIRQNLAINNDTDERLRSISRGDNDRLDINDFPPLPAPLRPTHISAQPRINPPQVQKTQSIDQTPPPMCQSSNMLVDLDPINSENTQLKAQHKEAVPVTSQSNRVKLDLDKRICTIRQIFKLFRQISNFVENSETTVQAEILMVFIYHIVSQEIGVEFNELIVGTNS
jgi:hypothetical protein